MSRVKKALEFIALCLFIFAAVSAVFITFNQGVAYGIATLALVGFAIPTVIALFKDFISYVPRTEE